MENIFAQQNVMILSASVIAVSIIVISLYAYILVKKAKSIIANANQKLEEASEAIKEIEKNKETIQSNIEELIEEEDSIKSRITYSNNFLAVVNKDREEAAKKYATENNEYKNNLEILKDKLHDIDMETKDLQRLKIKAEEFKAVSAEWDRDKNRIAEDKQTLHDLQSKIDLYSRVDEFVDYGFYEQPEYLFDTSERFSLEIKKIRDKQKKLIKDDKAVMCSYECRYDIDVSFINKLLPLQKKLAIRAFNIECDLLMSKVNPGNFERTLRQISAIAGGIEKEMVDMRYGFNGQYIALKMEECKLQYQFMLKKKEEIEEQRALREQIREEERARREYEREIALAEKEEDTYQRLLEKAREEFAQTRDTDKQIAELRIQQLESQLADAIARAERAKSMAEQTKHGHVYIISNIGSFGEDIYKIGLTRRLDPTERVKELSDASVPFAFDIHAMIASDDAPALEKELHVSFDDKRVNAVNLRKEFFHVKLDEIKSKAQQLTGKDSNFITTILANEYFQTKRLRSEH